MKWEQVAGKRAVIYFTNTAVAIKRTELGNNDRNEAVEAQSSAAEFQQWFWSRNVAWSITVRVEENSAHFAVHVVFCETDSWGKVTR